MKPQREGGGNNIYGSDILTKLGKIKDSKERLAYILMEKITPPVCQGYIVRPGEPIPPPLSDLVSELGIFGVIIGYVNRIEKKILIFFVLIIYVLLSEHQMK